MAVLIDPTATVHPGVVFEGDAQVEAFCVIGAPVAGREEQPRTVIGADAIIRSHTVIYAGNRIGSGFRTGNKANVREDNLIGDNVSIGTLAVVEHHVTLENGVRLHSACFVPEYCVLEEGSWVGPNAVLTNTRYPLSPGAKVNPQPVRLGRGAVVGANATILPGVLVGREAIVGAGSVVVRDVPDGTVVAGNPARHLRSREELPYGPTDQG